MKLSVLIPIYNEAQFLEKVITKVLEQKVPGIQETEIVLIDDGSNDDTAQIINRLNRRFSNLIALKHPHNQGKGAAIQSAIKAMTGDVCIIQDADLEYDPSDYPLMLDPIIRGEADCVYGSRFVGSQAKRVLFFWHYAGNRFLTLLSNLATNLNLTDMETGYKAFRCDLLKTIPLQSPRFGFEPEITIKIARRKYRIFEVGISYRGRTYAEGKKITWQDGFKAIFTIIQYSCLDRSDAGGSPS